MNPRRKRGARLERPRLYSDERQPFRQPAERSGQLDGVGNPEPVRSESRRITAQWRTAEIPHLHPARVAARVDRINDDHVVVSVELLDERDRLVEHDHRNPWKAELRDTGRYLRPDRVVAAGAVPDADYEGWHAITAPQR
jgi:hypothetical protein